MRWVACVSLVLSFSREFSGYAFKTRHRRPKGFGIGSAIHSVAHWGSSIDHFSKRIIAWHFSRWRHYFIHQKDDAALLVYPLTGEYQAMTGCRGWQEWTTAPKQDRNHRRFYRIDIPKFEKRTKQFTATEQPDVFPRLGAKLLQRLLYILGNNRNTGVLLGTKPPGTYHNVHLLIFRLL